MKGTFNTGVMASISKLLGKGYRSNNINEYWITLAFVMSLLLPEVAGSSCRRRITEQLVTYKNCVPKKLMTHSCTGSCVTHTQVDPSNPIVLERTCYQCKEAVIKKRKVKVKCPNPEGPAPFKDVIIEVPVPKECMCQSCSFDSAVNVKDSKL